MIEPLRSQYLFALGIENYVPRFILPGAKLSASCEWLEAAAETTTPSALIDDGVVNAAALAKQALSEKNIPEKSVGDDLQRTPIFESTVKRPARVVENIVAKSPATTVEAGPQFALSIVLAAGGLLLVDAAPVSSAERSAYQQLLNNMLPALRPAASQYVLDVFIWPMTKQPKIARDASAAIETLAAYLHKQIQQRTINTVLLLGEAAQQWCTFADSDVRVVKSTSLLACVQDPALKRSLWNDIRHIAES